MIIRRTLVLLSLAISSCVAQSPAALPVHYVQGAARAFMLVRSEKGAILGYGELLLTVKGDRVNSRLIYRFRDGSIDDDDTTFTQSGTFHLLSDHHIQRGPFFAKAIDMLVEESGNITLKTIDRDGKEKVETSHLELPPNISNGLTGIMLLNVRPDSSLFKLGLVAPVEKGRLIDLAIAPVGEESFSPVAGTRRKVTVFKIHPELGGVTGVIAPLIGKQPEDLFVWILEGPVPGLVREIGQLSEGGPIVSVEPAGATYPPAAVVKK